MLLYNFIISSGILYVMVFGRIQLCYHEENRRPQSEHRRTGFHGPSVCR